MDAQARYQWIADHILSIEGEVRGWLRRHMHTLSASDIDDLLQESYARVWSANLAGIGNGRSYFYTVIRNLLLEQARRARIVPMERMGEIEELRLISDEPGPEQRASARQEFEKLQRVIANLPTQCRRAFEMRRLEGYSQREIAERMGISEKTVEKHVAKALARVIESMGTTPDSTPERLSTGANQHGTRNSKD
jgi:RNA polymerase sigma-70 factor (ECF subfamily)